MKYRAKIRISCINEQDKAVLSELIKGVFPDTKVREIAPKDGYLHTVLTIKKPNSTAK